jgi:hypothetical protein
LVLFDTISALTSFPEYSYAINKAILNPILNILAFLLIGVEIKPNRYTNLIIPART